MMLTIRSFIRRRSYAVCRHARQIDVMRPAFRTIDAEIVRLASA